MTWLPVPSGRMRLMPSGAPWKAIHSSPSPRLGAALVVDVEPGSAVVVVDGGPLSSDDEQAPNDKAMRTTADARTARCVMRASLASQRPACPTATTNSRTTPATAIDHSTKHLDSDRAGYTEGGGRGYATVSTPGRPSAFRSSATCLIDAMTGL